jgi:peptidyl-prolyl cis-trans isomerase C
LSKDKSLIQTTPKKWFWVILVAIIITWAAPPLLTKSQAASSKVATVNGTAITRADFDREVKLAQRRFASRGRSPEDSELLALKQKILENLINRELLYQECQNKAIKVEKTTINEQYELLKKRFPHETDFNEALRKLDFSEAGMKAQIERDLAIQQLITEKIVQKVTITDKESKAYYDSHPQAFRRPEQVHASHILISVDRNADQAQKAAARKKIEDIQKKLNKGEDFAALAREFSQCPSGSRGGDLGYVGRRQLVKPVEEVAFALPPGQVSDIVESPFGYHLITVAEKRPETLMGYEEIKVKLQEYLKQQRVEKQVNLYIEELKGKANVERFLADTTKKG